ncbi:hypothetical protein DFJ73DRAFT_792960 [Zopfochytrium polystomum]|nr:hypothetical protein DFJ73DRAFT_792960 [Zopfochytrium polystomum]
MQQPQAQAASPSPSPSQRELIELGRKRLKNFQKKSSSVSVVGSSSASAPSVPPSSSPSTIFPSPLPSSSALPATAAPPTSATASSPTSRRDLLHPVVAALPPAPGSDRSVVVSAHSAAYSASYVSPSTNGGVDRQTVEDDIPFSFSSDPPAASLFTAGLQPPISPHQISQRLDRDSSMEQQPGSSTSAIASAAKFASSFLASAAAVVTGSSSPVPTLDNVRPSSVASTKSPTSPVSIEPPTAARSPSGVSATSSLPSPTAVTNPLKPPGALAADSTLAGKSNGAHYQLPSPSTRVGALPSAFKASGSLSSLPSSIPISLSSTPPIPPQEDSMRLVSLLVEEKQDLMMKNAELEAKLRQLSLSTQNHTDSGKGLLELDEEGTASSFKTRIDEWRIALTHAEQERDELERSNHRLRAELDETNKVIKRLLQQAQTRGSPLSPSLSEPSVPQRAQQTNESAFNEPAHFASAADKATIQQLGHRVRDLERAVEDRDERVEDLSQQLRRMQRAVADAEAASNAIRSEADSRCRALDTQVHAARADADAALARAAASDALLNDLESELGELRARSGQELAALRSALERATDESVEAKKRAEDAEKASAEAETRARSRASSAAVAAQGQARRLADLQSENKGLVERLDELRGVVVELQDERATLVDRLHDSEEGRKRVEAAAAAATAAAATAAAVSPVAGVVGGVAAMNSVVTSETNGVDEATIATVPADEAERWNSVVAHLQSEVETLKVALLAAQANAIPVHLPTTIRVTVSTVPLLNMNTSRTTTNITVTAIITSMTATSTTTNTTTTTTSSPTTTTTTTITMTTAPITATVMTGTAIAGVPPPPPPAVSSVIEAALAAALEAAKAAQEAAAAANSQVAMLKQELQAERHKTELLAMEVDCLPEYISLYHKERRLLRQKVLELTRRSENNEPINVADELAKLDIEVAQMVDPVVGQGGGGGVGGAGSAAAAAAVRKSVAEGAGGGSVLSAVVAGSYRLEASPAVPKLHSAGHCFVGTSPTVQRLSP